MDLNMRLCRDCADFTSTWNRERFLAKPKTMVAAVRPGETEGSFTPLKGHTVHTHTHT